MSELSAFLGGILITLGAIVFVVRKSFNNLFDGITENARAVWDRVGQKKFLFFNYGKLIQYKIRQAYEEFGKEVFEKESPAEKEAALKPFVERDLQKRKREERKKQQ